MLGLRSEPIASYRVEVGLDYNGIRREPGDVVTDLPPESIDWLTAQHCITRITEGGE